LLALLVAVVSCALINDENMINRINSHPKASWKAKAHKQFEGKTLEHVRGMLGTFLPIRETLHIPRETTPANAPVPKSFDARTKWPKCIGKIRDQQQCGSCWAFSGAEALGDRFCIATNGSMNSILSPQYILSCDQTDYGCNGGYLSNEWTFLSTVGTTTDDCSPYVSGGGDVPQCPTTCQDGSAIKLYKADPKTVKLFDPSNLEAVQQDIATYGSVQMGFNVYQDFFTYSSGVYRHLSGGLAGGHAVKYVGWGVDSASGLPYWIAANSWGESWGNNGFFWILRGSNECDCESQIYSARPLLQ
jgi:cathepsin B